MDNSLDNTATMDSLDTTSATPEPGTALWKDYEKNRKYNKKWEMEFNWVRRFEEGVDMAFCKVCNCKILPKISNIRNHNRTKRHQRKISSVLAADVNGVEFDAETYGDLDSTVNGVADVLQAASTLAFGRGNSKAILLHKGNTAHGRRGPYKKRRLNLSGIDAASKFFHQPQKEPDCDELFMASITLELKQIKDMRKRSEVKMQIIKMVSEAVYKEKRTEVQIEVESEYLPQDPHEPQDISEELS